MFGKKKSPVRIWELLVGLFVVTLVVSNIASVKIVHIGPLVMDAGTLLFPLAYIVGDVVTEVYGFRKMRSLLYVGVSCLMLAMLTFWLVGLLPSDSGWTNQAAYDSILGVSLRIASASIIAIFVGELINSYVLARMKIASQGKNIWQRIIGSSAIGNAVDTTLFSLLAFAGTMSFALLVQLIMTVYVIKMMTEIIVSPLTMRVIAYIKQREGQDSYESPSLRLVG